MAVGAHEVDYAERAIACMREIHAGQLTPSGDVLRWSQLLQCLSEVDLEQSKVYLIFAGIVKEFRHELKTDARWHRFLENAGRVQVDDDHNEASLKTSEDRRKRAERLRHRNDEVVNNLWYGQIARDRFPHGERYSKALAEACSASPRFEIAKRVWNSMFLRTHIHGLDVRSRPMCRYDVEHIAAATALISGKRRSIPWHSDLITYDTESSHERAEEVRRWGNDRDGLVLQAYVQDADFTTSKLFARLLHFDQDGLLARRFPSFKEVKRFGRIDVMRLEDALAYVSDPFNPMAHVTPSAHVPPGVGNARTLSESSSTTDASAADTHTLDATITTSEFELNCSVPSDAVDLGPQMLCALAINTEEEDIRRNEVISEEFTRLEHQRAQGAADQDFLDATRTSEGLTEDAASVADESLIVDETHSSGPRSPHTSDGTSDSDTPRTISGSTSEDERSQCDSPALTGQPHDLPLFVGDNMDSLNVSDQALTGLALPDSDLSDRDLIDKYLFGHSVPEGSHSTYDFNIEHLLTATSDTQAPNDGGARSCVSMSNTQLSPLLHWIEEGSSNMALPQPGHPFTMPWSGDNDIFEFDPNDSFDIVPSQNLTDEEMDHLMQLNPVNLHRSPLVTQVARTHDHSYTGQSHLVLSADQWGSITSDYQATFEQIPYSVQTTRMDDSAHASPPVTSNDEIESTPTSVAEGLCCIRIPYRVQLDNILALHDDLKCLASCSHEIGDECDIWTAVDIKAITDLAQNNTPLKKPVVYAEYFNDGPAHTRDRLQSHLLTLSPETMVRVTSAEETIDATVRDYIEKLQASSPPKIAVIRPQLQPNRPLFYFEMRFNQEDFPQYVVLGSTGAVIRPFADGCFVLRVLYGTLEVTFVRAETSDQDHPTQVAHFPSIASDKRRTIKLRESESFYAPIGFVWHFRFIESCAFTKTRLHDTVDDKGAHAWRRRTGEWPRFPDDERTSSPRSTFTVNLQPPSKRICLADGISRAHAREMLL